LLCAGRLTMCCDYGLTLFCYIVKQRSPSSLDWLPTTFLKVGNIALILFNVLFHENESNGFLYNVFSCAGGQKLMMTVCYLTSSKRDTLKRTNINKVLSQYLHLLFRVIEQRRSRDVKATAKQWHYHNSENCVNSTSTS